MTDITPEVYQKYMVKLLVEITVVESILFTLGLTALCTLCYKRRKLETAMITESSVDLKSSDNQLSSQLSSQVLVKSQSLIRS